MNYFAEIVDGLPVKKIEKYQRPSDAIYETIYVLEVYVIPKT